MYRLQLFPVLSLCSFVTCLVVSVLILLVCITLVYTVVVVDSMYNYFYEVKIDE